MAANIGLSLTMIPVFDVSVHESAAGPLAMVIPVFEVSVHALAAGPLAMVIPAFANVAPNVKTAIKPTVGIQPFNVFFFIVFLLKVFFNLETFCFALPSLLQSSCHSRIRPFAGVLTVVLYTVTSMSLPFHG